MKKLTSLCVMLGALVSLTAFAQNAAPGESRLTVGANIDYSTKYIWRAFPVNDEAVLQPSIAATFDGLGPGKLGVKWWGNYNLTDSLGQDAENRFIEYDWQVGYGMDLPGNSMVEFGMIYYYFPRANKRKPNEALGAWQETFEFYTNLEVGLVDTDALDASAIASIYYDADEAEGIYVNAGLKGDYILTDKWATSLSAVVGCANSNYNSAYFGVSSEAINDFTIEAAIGAPIDDHISIKFGLGYSDFIDSDIERFVDRIPGRSSSNTWFKVGLHAQF